MSLITNNSILKNLPPTLGYKHILILDSLRFLMEMVDSSYEELVQSLLSISKKSKRNTPQIFGYAWSIIDNTSRIIKIAKQLPWEYPDKILGHLNYINKFRNTFQHLDERIDESLIKAQSPFIGVITWFYRDFETDEIDMYQLISGNLIAGPNATQTVLGLEDCVKPLNAINLHTVDKKANVINIDIDTIIVDLQRLVREFELRFKDFKPCDWSKRQDVVLCIKTGVK